MTERGSIHQIFRQAWVPLLRSLGQVYTSCVAPGFKIPSWGPFRTIGERFVKDIERCAKEHCVPFVHFNMGENKEESVRPLLETAVAAGADSKVVLIGVAQQKASIWP